MLESEASACALVERIGLHRAHRLLDAIVRRIDRRYAAACLASFSPINREWVRQTPLEVDLIYKLKLGISILDDYHTPAGAKRRIAERIQKRKTLAAQRRASVNLGEVA